MKKFICIFAVSVVILCIGACAKKQPEAEAPRESLARIEDIKDKEPAFGSLSLKECEDSQPYWNSYKHNIAAGNNGYYFINDQPEGRMLVHMDPKTGECAPVCTRQDCRHTLKDNVDNIECPAIFENYLLGVWYYNGSLYLIRINENNRAVLVQTDINSQERKDLFEIGVISSKHSNIFNLVFIEDDVYIYNRTQREEGQRINIRRRSLEGGRDIDIVTSGEKDASIDSIKAYGGKLFFVYTHTEQEKTTTKSTLSSDGLFCYDPDTDKVGKVIDKSICDLAMDEDEGILYYYVIKEGLYRYDTKKDAEELIYEAEDATGACNISFDGKYICLDNGAWCDLRGDTFSKKVTVLDAAGNELNVLERNDDYYMYFGDSGCILKEVKMNGSMSIGSDFSTGVHKNVNKTDLLYILKPDIENAKKWEWKKAEWKLNR